MLLWTDRGLAAPALLDGERKRPAHVLEALPFALVRAGTTEVAERPRRLGQSELGGERAAPRSAAAIASP